MAKKFILILGGVRSGKSSFAQSLTERLGKKVLFVATAESLDEEMASRIEEHKRRRPKNWRTLNSSIWMLYATCQIAQLTSGRLVCKISEIWKTITLSQEGV